MTRSFYVLGPPIQQGSMTCKSRHATGYHANLQADNEHELDPWREKVAAACRRDYPGSGPVVTYAQYEPVALVITYSLLRPASHYGTGRNAGIVKPSAPQYPTARGTKDMDKLERAIFDALQAGGVVHDDAQIVDCTHRKRYAGTEYPHGDVLAEPGVLIRIYPGGD